MIYFQVVINSLRFDCCNFKPSYGIRVENECYKLWTLGTKLVVPNQPFLRIDADVKHDGLGYKAEPQHF